MSRLLTGLLVLLWLAGPAVAERVVTSSSLNAVSITQSFSGETMTLFGNIEPDIGESPQTVQGSYDVILVVTGPASDRVVRKRTHNWGMWINTEQVVFDRVPSYFRVLASRKLTSITSPATLTVEDILAEDYARRGAEADWWNAVVFGNEMVRLMGAKGYYGINESGVLFLSDTLYSARLSLPSDIPNGAFVAHTYVFRNGEIVARAVDEFSVRKAGFERFLGTSATQYPLLYGLACVALALLTGWLGGVIFKR